MNTTGKLGIERTICLMEQFWCYKHFKMDILVTLVVCETRTLWFVHSHTQNYNNRCMNSKVGTSPGKGVFIMLQVKSKLIWTPCQNRQI